MYIVERLFCWWMLLSGISSDQKYSVLCFACCLLYVGVVDKEERVVRRRQHVVEGTCSSKFLVAPNPVIQAPLPIYFTHTPFLPFLLVTSEQSPLPSTRIAPFESYW
jgi:hypothetical protein